MGRLGRLRVVPHCCSEAGTLALSRPEISAAMLHRKGEALQEALGDGPPPTLLTNCPSCLQGLGRQGCVVPQHMTEFLAQQHSGTGWLERFEAQAGKGAAFTF